MAKIVGSEQVSAKLRKGVSRQGMDLVQSVLFEAGQRIQTDAQTSITEGAVSGAGHVPSLPGQPPNNDTGVLANNIETLETGPFHVTVSSNARYSAALEFGTSKVAARPFMEPALQKNKKRITKRVAAAVNQANRMK